MRQYCEYTPEEFATDEYFLRWIKFPDVSTEAFWQEWLERYPYKRSDVETARQIVLLAIHAAELDIEDIELKALKASIFSKISQSERGRNPLPMYRKWYSIAAAILVAAGLAYSWIFIVKNMRLSNRIGQNPKAAAYDKSIEERNFSKFPKLVNLPDGSSVLLKPQSKLSYSKQFNKTIREVYLTGEAFFEVTKNPDKPFFVHANEITTKVLGTSFNIKAYLSDRPVQVAVKTGRVSIYKTDGDQSANAQMDNELSGLVIHKGQVAVFDEGNFKLYNDQRNVKQIAVEPLIQRESFEFEDARIKDVFNRIEQAYSVDINYDKLLFDNCTITASLSDEPFVEKLRLVCKAVRANYTISGRDITIKGEGCK